MAQRRMAGVRRWIRGSNGGICTWRLLLFGPCELGGGVFRQRPYSVEYTRSHPNSEVKLQKARSVLGWGTAWEALRVLLAFCGSAWCAARSLRATRRGLSPAAILCRIHPIPSELGS